MNPGGYGKWLLFTPIYSCSGAFRSLTALAGRSAISLGVCRPIGATRIKKGGATAMNSISKWAAALALLSGAAYGQAPSTNDTSDANGNTGMGSHALVHFTTGGYNTASGFEALNANTTGSYNSASGDAALGSNTTGSNNTATGHEALLHNATGNNSTAVGYQALWSDISLGNNTAVGAGALYSNSSGGNNNAVGAEALRLNTTGNHNNAFGTIALLFNTSGVGNNALGNGALESNSTGSENTAVGDGALLNSNASNNSALGAAALSANTSGQGNTAAGFDALYSNTTGSNNIAVGYQAGYNVTTSNNIDIGNSGLASDNGAIRIGTGGSQKALFIAGISNSKITGSAVYVTAGGRLGVLASSERYKTAIEPMGSNTAKLEQLRPVTFHLKTEPKGALQYGLIAEEVAKVYPELVIRDEKGRIQGVRYDELAPMLLNEVQKQAAEINELKQQQKAFVEMKKQLTDVQAALAKLQSKDPIVAQR
jgi:hypothetical protein